MKLILKYLGNFGRYQALLYALCFVPAFLGGSTTLMYQWTGFMPDVRCRLPEEPFNATYAWAADNGKLDRYVAGRMCEYCPMGRTDCASTEGIMCSGDATVMDARTALVPDSLAIRHGLFCNDVWKQRLVWSMNTVGFGIGAVVFGTLSDKLGRRRVYLGCAVGLIAVTHALPFATDYTLFVVLQVALGAIQTGSYLTMYIIFMEVVDGMPRTLCGVWYQGMFAAGMLWDALCAYAISADWAMLQWLSGAPSLLLMVYFFVLPESIRWSAVNGRVAECRRTIKRAARINKVDIPDLIVEQELNAETLKAASSTGVGVTSLFSHWRLTKNTLIMFYSW